MSAGCDVAGTLSAAVAAQACAELVYLTKQLCTLPAVSEGLVLS
jgi:hypothetical protein